MLKLVKWVCDSLSWTVHYPMMRWKTCGFQDLKLYGWLMWSECQAAVLASGPTEPSLNQINRIFPSAGRLVGIMGSYSPLKWQHPPPPSGSQRAAWDPIPLLTRLCQDTHSQTLMQTHPHNLLPLNQAHKNMIYPVSSEHTLSHRSHAYISGAKAW